LRPTLDIARKKAAEIAGGEEKLTLALADPSVHKLMQLGIDLYDRNEKITRTLRIPQLIIGDVINAGPVRYDQLLDILRTHLDKARL
jgi:hypothetical protein